MSATRAHRALSGAFLAAALAAAMPGSLTAQQHPSNERGFDPEKVYQLGGIDSVSLFNLGVTVTIPIGPRYPLSERFSYGLTLVGSSKAWDFQDAEFQLQQYGQAVPERFSNAGAGFSLSLGRIIGPDSPYNDYETNRWVYIDPAGGEHIFYKDLHDPGNTTTTYCTDTEYCATRDSSYLRMRRITTTKREVHFPDGTIHVFERYIVGPQWEWRLTAMRDSFEEGAPDSPDVSVSYSADANTWTIQDRLGRSHTVVFETETGDRYRRRLKVVELDSFGGGTATYSFGYHPLQPIPVPCSSTLPHWNAVTASQLASVTLPDGTSYGFTYYGGGSASGTCYGAGTLRSVTLPTGGSIEYVYDAHTISITGCNHRSWHKTTVGVATRTFRDRTGAVLGAWEYSSTVSDPPPHPPIWCDDLGVGYTPPPEELTVEVITPLKDKERYFFSVWPGGDGGQATTTFDPLEYGLPFTRKVTDGAGRFKSVEVLDCDANGQYCGCDANGQNCGTARTTYVKYERDSLVFCNFGPECYDTNRRLIEQSVVYEDGKTATTVSSSYDGFGNHRTVTLGGTFGAGNSRTTTTNYNQGNVLPGTKWILGTYTEQTTTEGGVSAKREVCFDANGFLARERALKSGTNRGGDDVIVLNTPDAAGNLLREEYFGGDYVSPDPGLNTTQPLCSLSLGATANDYRIDHDYTNGGRWRSRYANAAGQPESFSILEQSIDANTGLVSSSTDTAGVVTSYSYESLGRLSWVKPQSGQGAWVQHVYTTDVPSGRRAVEIRHRVNGSENGDVLRESKLVFDDLGRLWQEHQKMADDNWSVRETLYNAMGWKSSVSQLGFAGKKTQYAGYDPYGRPGTVTAPDGKQVTFSYTGVSEVARKVEVADVLNEEHPAWTTEFYDRQGRLFQVKEEAEARNEDGNYENTITTYSYDVGSRLSRVKQETSAGTQNRWLTYDNRGFLRSEQHPEKGGIDGNGFVYHEGYDARGHAGRRYECEAASCVATPTQRVAHLTFGYDRAERLTAVTDVTTGSRPLKSFIYGNSAAAQLRTKGRLETATRYNYFPDIGATVQVFETYRYAGPQGRVSQKDTRHSVNGLDKEAFQQTWTYDDLGQVEQIGYPNCTTPTLCSNAPRSVSFTHTNGMLTAVPGFASSIEYHPNGAYKQVLRANGVVDKQDVTDGMPRPSKLSASTANATLWTSGVHSYDGAGNVAKIGGSYFLYDHVSRVVDGHVYDGPLGTGALRWQTYSYDPFGNIKSIGGDFGSPGRTTDTNPASNRLTFGGYDEAGNLEAWNNNLYEYDALGMMTRLRTGTTPGSDDWRYIYTADDERYWAYLWSNQSGGSLWTLRDLDGKVLREYDAHRSWTTFRDYVYRGSQLLASEGLPSTDGHQNSFNDVPPNHLYAAEIEAMKASGVTAGCGNGQYCPGLNVTRAQIMVFLYAARGIFYTAGPAGNAARCSSNGFVAPFNDVPDTYSACAYIARAKADGLTNGCGNGNYCPELSVTTGQVAVFISQSNAWNPPACIAGQEAFSDVPASHSFCRHVEEMNRRGIDNGCGGGAFCMNTVVTRGMMAPRIARGFSLPYPDKGYTKHYHVDHLGTPRLITSKAASKLDYLVYFPFGEEVNTEMGVLVTAEYAEQMKFTGHERDSLLTPNVADDLDYMHARYYNPQLGRFLSIDSSTAFRPGVPQSWNRYVYADDRPLSLVDPDGEDAMDFATGFADAVVTNFTLQAHRDEPRNGDYAAGRVAGDLASSILGVIEYQAGAGVAAGSVACEVGSAGMCSGAAVPGAVAGVAVAAHGVASASLAMQNLLIAFREATGQGSGGETREPTPTSDPKEFDPVRGSSAKKNRETGEIWQKDRLHRDHWEVYKDKKDWENGKRDRAVWDGGRLKETF